MSKNSNIHYNEKIREFTIEMFMEGKSPEEIERAIYKKVRNYRRKGNK